MGFAGVIVTPSGKAEDDDRKAADIARFQYELQERGPQ
jgi:hypothetical protein